MDGAELVRLAGGGDQHAWRELVGRYAPMVWRIARLHRLGHADAADVGQSVWIRLAENLARLREPDRVGSWLGTVTRRECLRVLASRGRVEPSAELEYPDRPEMWPETVVLRGARDATLWQAFRTLSDRCQRLVGLAVHAPELTYAQLAAAAGVTIGNVGSVKSRCLQVLRRRLLVLGVDGEAVG